MKKLEALRNLLREMIPDGFCLAVSGGVDSSLLLALLAECSQSFPESFFCVSFLTELQSEGDHARMAALSERYPDLKHESLFLDLLSDAEFAENPLDRCYLCKKKMFFLLRQMADSRKFKWILDGTQLDDLSTYRPGLKALHEFGVRSPLAECGVGKEEVRRFARHLGLSSADLPSKACLATRIPHGTRLDPETLQAIDRGESFLRRLGFLHVRIRLHGDLARIEVPEEDFPEFLRQKSEICKNLKFLPARYFCLDLAGFSSGSMDPDRKIQSR